MISNIDNYLKKWTANNAQRKLGLPQGGQAFFNQKAPVIDPSAEIIEEEKIQRFEVMAEDTKRGTYGENLGLPVTMTGTATNSRKIYPLYKQIGMVGADQLRKRVLGVEAPFETPTRTKQMNAYIRTQQIATLNFGQVARATELGCWNVLQSSKLITKNQIITYGAKDALVGKTAKVKWDAVASKPLEDIGNCLKQIRQNGLNVRGNPIAIFGDAAFDNFKNQMKTQGNLRGIQIFDVSLEADPVPSQFAFLTNKGLMYHGWVIPAFYPEKIHCFTYPQYYDSGATGVSTAHYINTNNCIVMYNDPEYFQMYYGPTEGLGTCSEYFTKTFGSITANNLSDEELMIGDTYIPAEAHTIDFFGIDRNMGVEVVSQLAPMPMLQHANNVVCIDTSTATAPIGE